MSIDVRPQYGLCLPAKVMYVIAADHLLLHLTGHHEIELILIDCIAPPKTLPSKMEGVIKINPEYTAARDFVAEKLLSATEIAAWIPQPARDTGWVRNLGPQSKHAGCLYLDKHRTLNQELLDAKICRQPRQSFALLSA